MPLCSYCTSIEIRCNCLATATTAAHTPFIPLNPITQLGKYLPTIKLYIWICVCMYEVRNPCRNGCTSARLQQQPQQWQQCPSSPREIKIYFMYTRSHTLAHSNRLNVCDGQCSLNPCTRPVPWIFITWRLWFVSIILYKFMPCVCVCPPVEAFKYFRPKKEYMYFLKCLTNIHRNVVILGKSNNEKCKSVRHKQLGRVLPGRVYTLLKGKLKYLK